LPRCFIPCLTRLGMQPGDFAIIVQYFICLIHVVQCTGMACEFEVMTPVGVASCQLNADGAVIRFSIRDEAPGETLKAAPRENAAAQRLVTELDAYFSGTLKRFTVPLAPSGTAFQKKVWDALLDIPCGSTTTYGALAKLLGNPGAMRAVGAANGANPIWLLIPCHRVIGSQGLHGYAGGLARKAWILQHEGVPVPESWQQRLPLEAD
jgi:methylated-DNA-[protein]-cysteine S-methyltransferase